MDDDEAAAAAARAAARRAKKKKKKDSAAGGDEGADGGGTGGEARKKKKRRPKAAADGGDGDEVRASRSAEGGGGGGEGKKKKKKRKPKEARGGGGGSGDGLDGGGEGFAAAVAVAPAAAVSAFDEEADAKRGYGDDFDDNAFGGAYGGAGDVELVEKEGYRDANGDDIAAQVDANGAGYGSAAVAAVSAGGAYEYPDVVQADTEVMAAINTEGLVQVDESGGIQAFVAETVAVDDADVGIIRSDAEVESEEKRKYTKWFCGAVAVLVVVIAAVAVPVTLKFAKGRKETRITVVTDAPTDVPSLMPSESPSNMPSSENYMRIVRALEPLSGRTLRDPGAPQYHAAMWLADEDPMQLDVDDEGNFERFQQRYVMALFYYAMDGFNWKQSQGWLTGESECYWFGIDGASEGCGGGQEGGCVPRTVFEGSYDKVCRIGMGRQNFLYGSIPTEMGLLTEMRWFEIQDDYLIGTIPEELGNWRSLHTILLGGNYLHGGFPSTFGDNELLGTIFIDRNRFNGTFPETLGTLTNLEWLDAEENNFVGGLPSAIGNLKSLRILNVNNNSLEGTLPDTWDENNLIEDFEVAYNKFDGELPESLGNAKFLKDLRASQNQLLGSIPQSYYKLENLEELYLDENRLTGELPQTAEPFYDGLQELSIHTNGFGGRFPVEHFEGTFRIKVLSLHRNKLTGTISANICARKDKDLAYTQLIELTADCDLMMCTCCTCYRGGELEPGQDRDRE
ncbi:hypothetical protein ACHAWF_016542 [Thalassiosira exigua]